MTSISTSHEGICFNVRVWTIKYLSTKFGVYLSPIAPA